MRSWIKLCLGNGNATLIYHKENILHGWCAASTCLKRILAHNCSTFYLKVSILLSPIFAIIILIMRRLLHWKVWILKSCRCFWGDACIAKSLIFYGFTVLLLGARTLIYCFSVCLFLHLYYLLCSFFHFLACKLGPMAVVLALYRLCCYLKQFVWEIFKLAHRNPPANNLKPISSEIPQHFARMCCRC